MRRRQRSVRHRRSEEQDPRQMEFFSDLREAERLYALAWWCINSVREQAGLPPYERRPAGPLDVGRVPTHRPETNLPS